MTTRTVSRRYAAVVAAWTAGGLALRLTYVLTVARDRPLAGDPGYFDGLATMIRHGRGWNDPYLFAYGMGKFPTATHPPLFSLVLAGSSFVGFDSPLGHRVFSACIGTAAIPLIALVAKRYAGLRAGMIAAGIAALYPYLWMNDVNVLSESLLAVLIAAILLIAEATDRTPTLRRGALLGALIALAALTRGEELLLLPLLAWPLLLRGASPLREKLQRVAAATVAFVVLLAPWTAWNLTRFDHPVLISTDFGGTLFNTNCDAVWHGSQIGWWVFLPPCPNDAPPTMRDESTRDDYLRSSAWKYVSGHLNWLPVVVSARVGRIWGVFNPRQTRTLDELQGRGKWPTTVGFILYYPLLVLSVVGLVRLRRLRRSLIPFLALAAVVTITAALFYGSPHFRAPVDVGMVVLGAIGINALFGRRQVRAESRATTGANASIASSGTTV